MKRMWIAVAAACLPIWSHAFTATFEEGSLYDLGHGPVPVQPFSSGTRTVSFASATYVNPYVVALDGSMICPGLCAKSGHLTIAQYVLSPAAFVFAPIVADFNFSASSVSIWAISPDGRIASSLTAYDQFGNVVDSETVSGDPPGLSGLRPYSKTLTVRGTDIRSVSIDGQIWSSPGSGFNAIFDDLSVSPVPEPEIYATMLAGLGVLRAACRSRRTP